MPLLVPALAPPSNDSTQSSIYGQISRTSTADVSKSMPDSEDHPPSSPVAKLILDGDSISANLASALATSLIAHVLFLKSQIPFPVVQLYRLPSQKSNPRALKLRTELLASFDTLGSHLDTTFSALSTAFARSSSVPMTGRPTRRAYLAILVGPSISSAKTKVMFAVDGLVTKIWGERDDEESKSDSDSEVEESGSDEGASEEEDEGSFEAGDNGTPSESGDSDSEDDAPSPPPSRSPSPSRSPPRTSPPPVPLIQSQPRVPSPVAETQQTINAATRRLARLLATAAAEHDLSAELAPTQTHILVRAPRRFAHPAWIPRQTASAALDGALRAFCDEAQPPPQPPQGTEETEASSPSAKRKAKPRAPKTKIEGVWVGCGRPGVEHTGATSQTVAEEDELIWWSWDGKIVGFAEW